MPARAVPLLVFLPLAVLALSPVPPLRAADDAWLRVTQDEGSLEKQIARYLAQRTGREPRAEERSPGDVCLVLPAGLEGAPEVAITIDTLPSRKSGGKVVERVVLVRSTMKLPDGARAPEARARLREALETFLQKSWMPQRAILDERGDLLLQTAVNLPGEGVPVHAEAVLDAVLRTRGALAGLRTKVLEALAVPAEPEPEPVRPAEPPPPPTPSVPKPGEYRPETLARFRRLLSSPSWGATIPDRNSRKMLTAKHVETGLTFVLVPAGSFDMGDPEVENAAPVHRVTVSAFLICSTECPREVFAPGEWHRVQMHDFSGSPCGTKDVSRAPATGSWSRIDRWCRARGLRLPTEAEWEYACRAGNPSRWCFGNKRHKLGGYAEYGIGSRSIPRLGPNTILEVVDARKPNAWGLHGVHGNAAEWCQDVWHESYRGAPADGSAWMDVEPGESVADEYRVLRGGDRWDLAEDMTSASRHWAEPDEGGMPSLPFEKATGFRPAADLPR